MCMLMLIRIMMMVNKGVDDCQLVSIGLPNVSDKRAIMRQIDRDSHRLVLADIGSYCHIIIINSRVQNFLISFVFNCLVEYISHTHIHTHIYSHSKNVQKNELRKKILNPTIITTQLTERKKNDFGHTNRH